MDDIFLPLMTFVPLLYRPKLRSNVCNWYIIGSLKRCFTWNALFLHVSRFASTTHRRRNLRRAATHARYPIRPLLPQITVPLRPFLPQITYRQRFFMLVRGFFQKRMFRTALFHVKRFVWPLPNPLNGIRYRTTGNWSRSASLNRAAHQEPV